MENQYKFALAVLFVALILLIAGFISYYLFSPKIAASPVEEGIDEGIQSVLTENNKVYLLLILLVLVILITISFVAKRVRSIEDMLYEENL